MIPSPSIRRLWPDPSAEGLDDVALAAVYGRAQQPHLRVNFVTSVDGAVTVDGYSAGLSSPADKQIFGVLRMLCDALLVGAGTLRHEHYRAVRLDADRRAWRRDNGLPEFPTLVVVSRSLYLDPTQAAFADAPVRPIVVTTAKAEPPSGLTDVAEVLRLGDHEVDTVATLAELRRRGFSQVLSEGGPQLLGGLTAADLVDELCLTVSPQLVGPGAGRMVTGVPTPSRPLRLAHVLAADDVLALRYVRGVLPPSD